MNTRLQQAKAKVRELSRKGLDIFESKSLTTAQQLTAIEPIEALTLCLEKFSCETLFCLLRVAL